MSSQKPFDRALDEYLQDRSVLSSVYKETTDENPPEELDMAILAQARRATKGKARAARTSFVRNWMIPASLAAMLILTVGLVTFMFEEGVPFLPEVSPEPALESTMEEELPDAKRTDALESAGNRAADKTTDQQEPLKRKRRITAAHAPVVEDTALAKRQARLAEHKTAKVPEEPATRKPEGVPVERQIAPAAPAQRARVQAPESAATAGGLIQYEEQEREKDETREYRKEGRLDQPSAALRATIESKGVSPEEWLGRIGRLLRQGKPVEGYANLAAFKKRYPDYPLPFEPVPLRVYVDGRLIGEGEVVTLKRGQAVQLKVEVIRPDGTTSEVTNHPFTTMASTTPSNLTVSDAGLVTAPPDAGLSRKAKSIAVATVNIRYGIKRETAEFLHEVGAVLVQFELVD